MSKKHFINISMGLFFIIAPLGMQQPFGEWEVISCYNLKRHDYHEYPW